MSPVAENIIQRLDATGHKWWLCSLLTTTVLAVCVSLATFMVFMLLDSFWKFSQTTLIVLFSIWLVLSLLLLFCVGRRVLRGQRSVEAVARRIEFELPELGSDLINLVQLSERCANGNPVFCEAAVVQAARRVEPKIFDRAAYGQSRRQRFMNCMQTPRDFLESLIALLMLLAMAVVCQAYIPNWNSAALRLLAPWRFVPSVGRVEIRSVVPGNVDILVGESLEVAAEIDNPDVVPYQAVLFTKAEGEQIEAAIAMTPDENYARYKAVVPSIVKPFVYRLEIGDSQTETYRVGVREKPVVEKIEATLNFPAYMHKKSETFTLDQESFDLKAPQYTVVQLRVYASVAIVRGWIESGGEKYLGRLEDSGRSFVLDMPLIKDGTYTIHLLDDAGHSDRNPRMNRISVLVDKPPMVEVLKPAADQAITVASGEKLPVAIQAGDDYGLGQVRLEMKTHSAVSNDEATNEQPVEVIKRWTDFSGETATAAVCRYDLELSPEMFQPGQRVFLRAVAVDQRRIDRWGLDLRPQETSSAWREIRIVARDEWASAILAELENLRRAIWQILERQIRARQRAAEIHDNEQAKKQEIAADLRKRQIEIQKQSVALAESISDAGREEHRTIKRVLNALASDAMLKAVVCCEEMLKPKTVDMFKSAEELMSIQDGIIDVLRKLLDIVRRAEAAVLAEMKNRPGGDLPDDVKQKLQDIHGKLDEFLKQQKKIIEASENLAKKPVEDFTEEEKELLKALAAREDDLSKFLNELHSDMSKLPEQDFSNSSMAKELVEIQTELKMAADALTKQSVDIAVPLEQLGYEMAEELKSNLEKWLPDTPDRERWSQEESLTDKDKEAPMAELPGELEDLIGELMEQEEDLFDEMEDISSSAADSLDKGAGWDALDGPISNMSAKGVTGNRLPNTNEIGGRSGEGRQGKASGELVSEEAVGKGGRRTPTRLTNDPFVKGQIKDHSRQSAGGATGGGKESGLGGEGLEGPVPRSKSEREAARLAGKQATLRNKAESIDLQFQVSQYHHTDLKKMIEIMSQVEQDLRAGRYQNALRQRKVLLDGLGDVKKFVGGEFKTRHDTSVNLPADIQKELLGSMQDPSPPGWEQLNQRYFERLSNGKDKK